MATSWVERRLAAILAADVVGYSRLVEQDEAGTLGALKALRREVIDPLLAVHHGRIVKLMGDGAIVEFGSVVDAVACAVAVQKGAAEHQTDVPAERRIVFRIGVNLGDVVVEGEDLMGDGVNIAARLEQLCEPGGVMISGTVFDQLQGKINLPFQEAGEQQVKNIARPVRTYRVRLDGMPARVGRRVAILSRPVLAAAAVVLFLFVAPGVWWLWPGTQAPVGKPSIAVLPFDNLGGDEATGRLAEGITEDIITDLARFPEFEVVARNSTAVYQGKAVDVRQVGSDLEVGYVLEGSIQRQDERIRATAQLIDATTGTHVWSDRWDRSVEDVFAVQAEISEQLANKLGTGTGLIEEAGRQAARRKQPENLGAYELYLLGTEKLVQLTRESVAEALSLLLRAVDIDPTLARAWVQLSWAHSLTGRYGGNREAAIRAATDAARRAVREDPSDAEAHVVLGVMLGRAGDFARAEAAFDEALRLNPGSVVVLTHYAGWAGAFGKTERGAEAADKAIRINPSYPPWQANGFSWAFFSAGRYEEALRTIERQSPENWNQEISVLRTALYAALNRTEEARTALAEVLRRFPELTIEGFLSSPEFTDSDRQILTKLLLAAGFPPCARPEELARFPKPTRLPERLKS